MNVTNTSTGETFCTIQEGIDDSDTTDGHTLSISAGTYAEHVTVTKQLTLDGAGAGTDPMSATILDGSGLGAGSGIHVNNGVTNVTIQNLTVQNYRLADSNQAGVVGFGGNNNFTLQNAQVLNNSGGRGGVYLNGPVDTVLIDNVTAHNNQGRGIVIWNGSKTHIAITNNNIQGTNCCGIELQDGTASGVTMTDNTVVSNGDSGMSAIGLTSGAGPNVISGNTVTNNGRFGIEIKNPDGTGLDTGDGSIVIENNTVSITPSPAMNNRDHAGIAVFRRSFIAGNPTNYVDVPTGVVVRSNTVSGYEQQNASATASEGFGIVVEGVNHTVTGNTLNNNDVGIQEQGGNHANANYAPNDAGDGDQADGQSPEYFGRGNAPMACGNTISGNSFSGNTTDFRQNVAGSGGGVVTNTDTGEVFCSIQAAIDDSDTLDTHVIEASAGTFEEQVHINKAVTVQGQGVGSTIIKSPMSLPLYFTSSANNYPVVMAEGVDNAILQNLTVDGAGRGNSNYRFVGVAFHNASGEVNNVAIQDVRNTPLDGSQHGHALFAYTDDSGPDTVTVDGVTVSGFQKTGMIIDGAGLTGNITNSTVTGPGPLGTGLPAQNGIQYSSGATGSITNNIITGIAYEPGTWGAVGMLLFGPAGDITVTGNTVNDNQIGIYLINLGGTVSNNSLTYTTANMGATPDWWGIVADPGEGERRQPPVAPSDLDDLSATAINEEGFVSAAAASSIATVVSNNTLEGGSNGVGIEADVYGSETLDVQMTANTVSNFDTAIILYEDPGATLTATLEGNTLTNSGMVGAGVYVGVGAEATIGDLNDTGKSNEITGFSTGIDVYGTASIKGNIGSIDGNTTGILVENGGVTEIRYNDIENNATGVQFASGATSTEFACNNLVSNTTDADNLTGGTVDATYNYWDDAPATTGDTTVNPRLAFQSTVDCENDTILGVTIGYFHAARSGDGVDFVWQTATESGVAGFTLYAELDDEMTALTTEMIPSVAIDSVTPTSYYYRTTTAATLFYLDEQKLDGSVVQHGPFVLDEVYGDYALPGNIDLQPTLFLPLVWEK